jgi:endonuclease/exonuclease/phosphatase (EEP) superfamily protein YafD
VEDAERQHLLHELAASEKTRRRWRGLALALTPVLAVALVVALVNVFSLSLTLREVVKRERAQRERAEQAEREAQRQVYVSYLRQLAPQAEMQQQIAKPKP